jgi:hypothetical protein
MNDSGEWAATKHVLRLLAPDVDPVMRKIFRTPFEGASIDADDPSLAV